MKYHRIILALAAVCFIASVTSQPLFAQAEKVYGKAKNLKKEVEGGSKTNTPPAKPKQ